MSEEQAYPPWLPPETAPTDGHPFLAELSSGRVVILYATVGVRENWRYSWWGGERSIPYAPSHPADTDWAATNHVTVTGWMELPAVREKAP